MSVSVGPNVAWSSSRAAVASVAKFTGKVTLAVAEAELPGFGFTTPTAPVVVLAVL